jgi:aspartyl-tRNA(Asn)/glutamyl-tRNA(Gln) amidotransferase subunit C
MKVDEETLKHVAEMARVNLTDNEVEKFLPQLNEIIEMFSAISKVDTSGVKPSFQPVELKNSLRDDEETECLTQEEALKNSDQTKNGYFKGPRSL